MTTATASKSTALPTIAEARDSQDKANLIACYRREIESIGARRAAWGEQPTENDARLVAFYRELIGRIESGEVRGG